MATLCIHPNPSDHQHTLYDRVSKLLESFEWSDVTFVVEDKYLKAHKLILAISSPVFKAMLYGPMAEESEIVISDIEPQVFQLLLDFMYKDKVVMDSLENACGLLYASKKYMLPCLSAMCIKFIMNSTTVINVMSVYSFSEWIQEEALLKHCLSLICTHACVVLDKYFQHVPVACLIRILQETSMNITEKQLIKAVWTWSHNESIEKELNPTNDNKRQILQKSNILNYIRFLSLTKEDLDHVHCLGVLTTQEIEVLKHNMFESDEHSSNYESLDHFILNENTLRRSSLCYKWTFCSRSAIRSASPLVISNGTQSVKMKLRCQKTVFIGSFLFPSRQSCNAFPKEFVVKSYLEHVIITLGNLNNSEDCVCVTYNKVTEYDYTMLIEFQQPFLINEEEWYVLTVSWPGKKSQLLRYPLSYCPTTCCNSGTIFTFDDNFENLSARGCLTEGLNFCL